MLSSSHKEEDCRLETEECDIPLPLQLKEEVIPMRRPVPGLCPICGDRLFVTKLQCHRCATGIEGNFEPCRFCSLSPEHKAFLEVFVKCRGNIKEVEKELGISYPTVRNRLDGALEAMGFRADDTPTQAGTSARRKDVLDALSRGEIGADDAVKLLRTLR